MTGEEPSTPPFYYRCSYHFILHFKRYTHLGDLFKDDNIFKFLNVQRSVFKVLFRLQDSTCNQKKIFFLDSFSLNCNFKFMTLEVLLYYMVREY